MSPLVSTTYCLHNGEPFERFPVCFRSPSTAHILHAQLATVDYFFFHSYTLCIWDSQTGNVEWQISLQKEKCINFQIKKGKAVTFLKWQILKYNWEQLVFFSFSERKDETELIFQGQIVQNPVFGFSLSIIFLPPKFRKHYTKNKHK